MFSCGGYHKELEIVIVGLVAWGVLTSEEEVNCSILGRVFEVLLWVFGCLGFWIGGCGGCGT